MISGGELSLDLSRFPHFQDTVLLDVDKSSRGPLPNAASQPIPEGANMANDIGYLRLEKRTNARGQRINALRVQVNSEVSGLFGSQGGDWSSYNIVFEEPGIAYAQVVHDGAKGVYGEIFNLASGPFGGAAQRAMDIAIEVVAGYELKQAYARQKHPLYRLADWIQKNPKAALSILPFDLLSKAKDVFRAGEKRALLDIDHDNPNYEPSVNLVLTQTDTEFARFDAVSGSLLPEKGLSMYEGDLCIRFQSEVDLPEYGRKLPAGHKPSDPDPEAPFPICFTDAGVRVYDPQKQIFLSPSTSAVRLLLNAGVALVALGALEEELPLSRTLKAAEPHIQTDRGKEFEESPKLPELPKADQIQFDPWDDIGAAAWGGG